MKAYLKMGQLTGMIDIKEPKDCIYIHLQDRLDLYSEPDLLTPKFKKLRFVYHARLNDDILEYLFDALET